MKTLSTDHPSRDCHVPLHTDRPEARSGRAGAATATASDPLSWGAGTERDTAQGGGAGTADGERRRLRPPASRECEGAHALGAIVEAHCGHRGCGRPRPHPHASGACRAATTACAGETGGSVSGGVRCKSELDFDRAGGGVRTALGQTPRWRGIQARCVRKLSARLREPWVFRGCARV